MWIILLTLFLGFIIGRFKLLPDRFKPVTGWITTGSLIVLLTSMGAGLSSNPDLLQQLSQLGVNALLFAICSIAGSVFLVFLVQKTLFKSKGVDRQ